jgi:hypothetical protein
MAKPQVSRDTLKALASALGLKLSDEKSDELLPQVRRSAEAMAGLDDALGLHDVEPATIFRPDMG